MSMIWKGSFDELGNLAAARKVRELLHQHLGFGGYFIYETCEDGARRGINVLACVASLDSAFSMLELWKASRR